MEILSKLTMLTLENGVLDGGFATLTDSRLLKLKGGGSDSTSGNNFCSRTDSFGPCTFGNFDYAR